MKPRIRTQELPGTIEKNERIVLHDNNSLEASPSFSISNFIKNNFRTIIAIILIIQFNIVPPPLTTTARISTGITNKNANCNFQRFNHNAHMFAQAFVPTIHHGRPESALKLSMIKPTKVTTILTETRHCPLLLSRRCHLNLSIRSIPHLSTSKGKTFTTITMFDSTPLSNDITDDEQSGFNTTVDMRLRMEGSHASSTIPPTTTTTNNDDENEDTPMTMTTAPEINQWKTIMTAPPPPPTDSNTPPPSLSGSHLQFMSPYDRDEMEKYWDRLMPCVSYLGTHSAALIKRSLVVGYCAHRSQVRKSGEPFIVHPVEVGLLLAGLRMDAETIVAGLLHDTVEDTDLTFEELEAMFGPVVRNLVEGETKVSKLPTLEFDGYADEQAENLRQMFMAMTDDWRIIVVKLADRLHNMRTLRYMSPEKQLKISRETLDIFAPLAHRMGLWQFKSELEDTAFMYLYPGEYKRLNKRLRRNQTRIRETLEKSQEMITQTLMRDQTLMNQAEDVKVFGRRKELYSLWNKMKTKGEDNLDQITDVVALRVIIEPKEMEQRQEVRLCYHVLGLVQHLPGFQPVPTKVKDYISCPKPNGYQSLHTAVMLNGQSIEVQIRTSAMHRVAEYGMASHWAFYDQKKRATLQKDEENPSTSPNQDRSSISQDPQEDPEQIYNTPWLSIIKEWQDEVLCSRDFVDCVRRELLGKRVFVFLRNGKILNLTKGATVIDAAFQIRTDVGLKMYGVEINGKPVPFSYELKNGDIISVITGNGIPSIEWMRYATIRSTRSKLRSYFRKKQRESYRDVGEILVFNFLSMHAGVIQESTQLPLEIFSFPTTMEEMKLLFRTGGGRETGLVDSDIENLLVKVGKRRSDSVGGNVKDDRELLREVVAEIFQVPRSILENADRNDHCVSSGDGLLNIKSDLINVAESMTSKTQELDASINSSKTQSLSHEDRQASRTIDENEKDIKSSSSKVSDSEPFEIADPEYLCPKCLPVLGDEIVGTRLKVYDKDGSIRNKSDFVTATVHRRGCSLIPHATSMSETMSKRQQHSTEGEKNNISVDSVKREPSTLARSRLKMRLTGRNNGILQVSGRRSTGCSGNRAQYDVVKLKWDDSYISMGEEILYLAEVSIIAEDRKLLLADCSEVVSSLSTIVKTGSLSTEKGDCVLEFLIKVESLDHLQSIMNNLMGIRSVMLVERKFGSTL